jgi:hypothetical protein
MKKIPQYMHEPVSGINRYGIDMVRKALEIEARLYRECGRPDAANALRQTASNLKSVSKGTATFAQAFDWRPALSESEHG